MTRILFICHGNICRSPMAEFIMKDMVKKEGLADEFKIASAATSREELGNPVYPPARRILSEMGISCSGKTARQITKADMAEYDYLICMDSHNINNAIRIFGEEARERLSLLLDYTDTPGSVSDPWYTDDFESTKRDVTRGCKALLEHIKKGQ